MATMTSAAVVATALKHLPPFPPVVCKVMNLLSRKEFSFREVGETLKTDGALSAEVLRLSNSVLVGARFKVTSILEALAMVGVERLSGLLLTLSLSKMVKRAGATQTVRNCWRHSLASALAAKEFAASFGTQTEEAYQAGLFHEVGCLAFLMIDPRLYDDLITQDGDLLELERRHFGMDHCGAGALLIDHWQLPPIFAEVARHHQDRGLESNNLSMVVHAACLFADELGFSIRPPTSGPRQRQR